ncbi:fibronectin type III domain-containing protein, partial [Candidatus Saccharibacteria bacterium]|nr:fibronectin type III domain-containing protein [Candidatus Saccharibacteria bacterium]
MKKLPKIHIDLLRRSTFSGFVSRHWRVLMFISIPFISFLVAWCAFQIPRVSQFFRGEMLAGGGGGIFELSWLYLGLLLLSTSLYVYFDYRHHKKPLDFEQPGVRYSPYHHVKVVIIPLVRHRWKELSYWVTAGTSTLIVLAYMLNIVAPAVFAATPTVVTNSASNITHGAARLNGTISDDGGASLSSRGFEYGTDTSYGKTLSEDLPDSGSYDTWGETKDGTTLLNSRVVYHENYVYVGGPGKVQKFTPEGSYVSSIGSQGEGSGQFLAANGITFDASDNMFVLDGSDNMEPGFRAITKFAVDGTVLARWGERGCAEGQFSKGMGAIVSDGSYIYALDTGCSRIQKFDVSGNFIATWGWGVDDGSAALQVCTSGCQAGISGSGVGQLGSTAMGIYLDGSSLYVADSSNSRIQVFDTSGGYANAWGSAGSGPGQFNMPTDITKVGTTLYVIEAFNNRVQSFTTTGSPIAVWGTQGTNDGQFQMPFSITADSNNLYTAELGMFGGMNRIQKFTTSGSHLDSWGEPGPGELASPSDIAFAPDGSLFAISQLTFNVHHFSATGEALGSWGGGLGSGPGQFGGSIHGIAVDSGGNVYVSDKNDRIQKFSSTGTLLATWGAYGSGDNQFSTPAGIAIDNSNNVYVADSGNNRIQKFSSSGSFIEMWGWGVDDGSNVFQTCSSGCQAGIQGTGNGQFAGLYGLEFNPSNQLLVADGNLGGRVQTFSTTGAYQSQWAFDGGESCNGCYVTVDEQDNVYVTNSDGIKKYSPSGTFLTNIGSWGWGAEQHQTVRGIAVDGQGNVYVADEYKSLIHKYPQPISSNFFLTTSKLLCETTYHYRAFAVNSDGTGYGSDQTFLTGSCTNATVPGAPSGLTTSFIAYDTIAINWQEPSDFGGRALGDYIYEYKKSSDSTWISGSTPILSEMIGPLDENTSYDFRVAATNSIGTGPYTYMTVSTVDGGASHTLSSCADLQTINYDLIGTYTLAQDIDCSGYNITIQTGGGEEYTFDGIIPIGTWSRYGFRGTLNGNGHSIRNIRIANSEIPIMYIGLFSRTTDATIQNVTLNDIDYEQTGIPTGMVGGMVGYSIRTEFSNVSVTGDITGVYASPGTSDTIETIGGVIGYAELETTLNKVYSDVDISVSRTYMATTSDAQIFIGGLVSVTSPVDGIITSSDVPPEILAEYTNIDETASASLDNVYSVGDISATKSAGSLADTRAGIGGITAFLMQGTVNHAYTSGSLSASHLDGSSVSGLVGQALPGPGATIPTTIMNSFTATIVSNDIPLGPGMPAELETSLPLGFLMDAGPGYGPVSASNVYYDKGVVGRDVCFWTAVLGDGMYPNADESKCKAVNTDGLQPNYFKNNKINPPLDTWNFVASWRLVCDDYPNFVGQECDDVDPPVISDPPVSPPPPRNPP